MEDVLPNDFVEDDYLTLNPDVEDAVKKGIIKSGLEHYLLYGRNESRPIRKEPKRLRNLDNPNNLYNLGDLYHNYALFGFDNDQIPGIFYPNQCCKEPIIMAYIQYSIAKSKKYFKDEVSFAELFCADGYYAMVARHLGASISLGIDNNRDGYFEKAKAISQMLRLTNVNFIEMDVNQIDQLEKVEIVANIGGLYHVTNPREVLAKSHRMANKFLIVQSVVSMANYSPEYFETPAPGWTWGNRFNRNSFDNMIKSLGFNVIDKHFNELEGNDRLEDRGSVYYLIKTSLDGLS